MKRRPTDWEKASLPVIHLTKAQYLEYINNYKKVKAKKTNKKEQLKMGYGTKQSSQNIKYNHLKILF